MVKIKICGITNLKDAQLAISYGADAIGFVFAKSKRQIAMDKAKEIIDKIRGNALKVGVFVNEPIGNLKRLVMDLGLDAVQLHGDETPQYCMKIKSAQVIKTFRVKDDTSLKKIGEYREVFAYLLDTYSEKEYGGAGKTFDWNLALKAKEVGKPIILSGGLNLSNIQRAIELVTPYGVDISSSIEAKPGEKDSVLMGKIIGLVKALD